MCYSIVMETILWRTNGDMPQGGDWEGKSQIKAKKEMEVKRETNRDK